MALQIPDDQLLKARWLLSSEKERGYRRADAKGERQRQEGQRRRNRRGVRDRSSDEQTPQRDAWIAQTQCAGDERDPIALAKKAQGAAGLVRGFTQGAEKFRQQTASKIAGHGGGENCQVILSGLTDLVDIANPGRKGAVSRPRGAKARREPEVRDLGAESASLSKLLQAYVDVLRNACTLGGLGDGSVDANGLREHLEPMLHGKVKAPKFASQLLVYTARFMRGTTTFREMRRESSRRGKKPQRVSPETANDENAGRAINLELLRDVSSLASTLRTSASGALTASEPPLPGSDKLDARPHHSAVHAWFGGLDHDLKQRSAPKSCSSFTTTCYRKRVKDGDRNQCAKYMNLLVSIALGEPCDKGMLQAELTWPQGAAEVDGEGDLRLGETLSDFMFTQLAMRGANSSPEAETCIGLVLWGLLSGRLCTMLKAPAVQDAVARGIICMLPADHPIRVEGVASKSLLFSVLKDTCEQLVAVERASEKRRKLLGELLKLTGKFELLGHERFSVDVKLRFARKAGSPALNEKGISARVDARDLLDLMLDLAYSLARPPTLDQIKQQVAKASEREAKKWALRVLEPILAPKLATLDIEWAEVERSLRRVERQGARSDRQRPDQPDPSRRRLPRGARPRSRRLAAPVGGRAVAPAPRAGAQESARRLVRLPDCHPEGSDALAACADARALGNAQDADRAGASDRTKLSAASARVLEIARDRAGGGARSRVGRGLLARALRARARAPGPPLGRVSARCHAGAAGGRERVPSTRGVHHGRAGRGAAPRDCVTRLVEDDRPQEPQKWRTGQRVAARVCRRGARGGTAEARYPPSGHARGVRRPLARRDRQRREEPGNVPAGARRQPIGSPENALAHRPASPAARTRARRMEPENRVGRFHDGAASARIASAAPARARRRRRAPARPKAR